MYCISAKEIFLSTWIIFSLKEKNHLLIKGATTKTFSIVHETGYMNSDLFLQCLKYFTYHIKPPEIDIDEIHTFYWSLLAILLSRENFIIFWIFAPNSSHLMQPLHQTFFALLKTACAVEVEKWFVQHPGEVLTFRCFQRGFYYHFKSKTCWKSIFGYGIWII